MTQLALPYLRQPGVVRLPPQATPFVLSACAALAIVGSNAAAPLIYALF